MLFLCHSRRATLQMPLLPFVQPAGIIPKPQWQEIRKEGEETRVEEKSQLIICKTGNFNNVEARPLPRSTSPEPWAPDKGRGTHPSQALGLSLPLPHCRLLPSWIQVHTIPEAYIRVWKWLVLTEGLPKERGKKKKNWWLLLKFCPTCASGGGIFGGFLSHASNSDSCY